MSSREVTSSQRGEPTPPPAPLVVTGCQLRACVSGGTELQSAPLHLNSDFTNIVQSSPCLPTHYLIECSGQPGNVGIAVLAGHRGESGGQKDYVITISGSRRPHLGLAPPYSSSKAPQNRARVQLAPQLQPSASPKEAGSSAYPAAVGGRLPCFDSCTVLAGRLGKRPSRSASNSEMTVTRKEKNSESQSGE